MSVLYWRQSGDLVYYIVYQYGGMVACALNPPMRFAVLLYAVAKLCEYNDRLISERTGRRVSGHTLKHLVAGAASCCVRV